MIGLKEFELASYDVRGKLLWFQFAFLCCCVYEFGFLIKKNLIKQLPQLYISVHLGVE